MLGKGWECLMAILQEILRVLCNRDYFQLLLSGERSDFPATTHEILVTEENTAAEENTYTNCSCEGKGSMPQSFLLINTPGRQDSAERMN